MTTGTRVYRWVDNGAAFAEGLVIAVGPELTAVRHEASTFRGYRSVGGFRSVRPDA